MNPREKRKRRPPQSRTSGGMGFFSNDGPSTISTTDGQPKENRCQFNKVILRNAERVNDIRCLSKQREENSTRTTGDFYSRTQCQSPGWPSNCTWRPPLPWTTAYVKLVYITPCFAARSRHTSGSPSGKLFWTERRFVLIGNVAASLHDKRLELATVHGLLGGEVKPWRTAFPAR